MKRPGDLFVHDRNAAMLLEVERRQRNLTPVSSLVLPVVLTILNLAFCAWIHPELRDDPEGYMLTLYVLIQISVFVFFILGIFLESVIGILARIRIYPVTSWSKFLFLLFSGLGSSGFILYWAANILFLILHFREDLVTVLTAVILFTTMTVCFIMLGAVILGRLVGIPRLPGKVILTAAAGLVTIFAGVFVFRSVFFLRDVPMVSWTVHGILAARNKEYFEPVLYFLLMTALIVVAVYAGKANVHTRAGSGK